MLVLQLVCRVVRNNRADNCPALLFLHIEGEDIQLIPLRVLFNIGNLGNLENDSLGELLCQADLVFCVIHFLLHPAGLFLQFSLFLRTAEPISQAFDPIILQFGEQQFRLIEMLDSFHVSQVGPSGLL